MSLGIDYLEKRGWSKDNIKIVQFLAGCLGAIILIALAIASIAIVWFLSLPPSCEESEQVEVTGILYGFEKNNTVWEVLLDNVTYHFNYWDKSYMEKLLGFDVTITCCRVGKNYSFLTAYITADV